MTNAPAQNLLLRHTLHESPGTTHIEKVAIVQDWPVPAGVAQLRSFLGLANYFRIFVTGSATLAAPLKQPASGDKVLLVVSEAFRLQNH